MNGLALRACVLAFGLCALPGCIGPGLEPPESEASATRPRTNTPTGGFGNNDGAGAADAGPLQDPDVSENAGTDSDDAGSDGDAGVLHAPR